jgi:glutathione S-transferase
MLTLYYAPGACSMASHIALEETGAAYTPRLVQFATAEQESAEYRDAVNPRGKVPALQTDGGTLTENLAILTYIARSFPDAELLPTDTLGLARCLSHMAYLSNAVHPAFTRIARTARFAKSEPAQAEVKEAARETFWGLLQELDGVIGDRDWVMGTAYTACDPYTLVFYGWGARIRMPMTELKNYTSFKDRMLQRPAVRKVLERENSILLHA